MLCFLRVAIPGIHFSLLCEAHTEELQSILLRIERLRQQHYLKLNETGMSEIATYPASTVSPHCQHNVEGKLVTIYNKIYFKKILQARNKDGNPNWESPLNGLWKSTLH